MGGGAGEENSAAVVRRFKARLDAHRVCQAEGSAESLTDPKSLVQLMATPLPRSLDYRVAVILERRFVEGGLRTI